MAIMQVNFLLIYNQHLKVAGAKREKGGRSERVKMKVHEIMSSPVISEDVDTGIIKIASIMEELGVGSVVIT
ncbi:MAG: hypothetical protein IMF19_16295, partial [Proteobacteria bacterium]|nr:hypothetical protein [Pseudomonadota bacterium]